MSHVHPTINSSSAGGVESVCTDPADCCQTSTEHSDSPERIDGAGEPCPAPLVWQEIRENYLRDSIPWEMVRGSHRLTGQTWGTGRPLYFLNNFAGTAELFCLTAWLLKDQYRCVLFDTVEDRRARIAPTISDYAADLLAVADQHDDRQFSIYGAAFGAAVGLQAALENPTRVDRLVLQHGFLQRRLSLTERLFASLCLRSPLALEKLPQRRRFQAVNHKPWFPPFDDSRFEFLLQSTGTLPLRELARRALAIHHFNVGPKLQELTCPVMVVRTEGEGRLAAEAQNRMEKQLKNCRVEWMHSAGQHPYLTHPHRVAKLIKSFHES